MLLSDRIRTIICFFVIPLLCLLCNIISLSANDTHRSDDRALNRIFDEEVLSSNIDAIREHAASLSEEVQYKILHDWVLPSESHNSIRLESQFTSTQSRGGTLVSPVFDLIETADKLNRLEELQSLIEGIDRVDEVEQRDRLALLFLISLAREEHQRALIVFDELSERVVTQVYPELRDRWPETLVLWEAVKVPELYTAIAPLLNLIQTTQARPGINGGPDSWDRQMIGLAARVNEAISRANRNQTDPQFPTGQKFANWIPVSQGDCVVRAYGFPRAEWFAREGELVNLISQQYDYLYYRVPLTGDFEVECDLAVFDNRDTQLMVKGVCVVPQWELEEFVLTGLSDGQERFKLDPPLAQSHEWIHHRIVVRNQTCTILMNGREVYRKSFAESASPWLAIRSPFYGQSVVRDFRIAGVPQVPREFSLSSNRDLSGWLIDNPDVLRGGVQGWRYNALLGPEGGIISPRLHELYGSFQESLLRYERPFVEDTQLEYEFYYRAGEVHVHPALDQRVFCLKPEGVLTHQLTDGVWDRSGLDPRDLSENPDAGFRAESLSLVEGWNQLQLTLRERTVSLQLNGQPIYQENLSEFNNRTFGLFHYADQSEVRVRNMVYRGDWPTQLPDVSKQLVRDKRIDELDASRETLQHEADYSFENQQYAAEQFHEYRSNDKGELKPTDGGLRMRQPGSRSFANTWVSPRIKVSGDFDIEAQFERAELFVSDHGGSSLYLTLATSDPDNTHMHVNRGAWRNPKEARKSDVQAEFNLLKPTGVDIHFKGRRAEESTSGRLRIARRGKQIFFLFSESDSTIYRVIHEQEVNDRPLREMGIRLAVGTWSDAKELGGANVVWKRLRVQADSIEPQP